MKVYRDPLLKISKNAIILVVTVTGRGDNPTDMLVDWVDGTSSMISFSFRAPKGICVVRCVFCFRECIYVVSNRVVPTCKWDIMLRSD